MKKIKNNNFDIEILELVKVPLFFLFKVKIISLKNNQLFKKLEIINNAGIQVIDTNLVYSYELLNNEINMNKNDEIEGYIAYRKLNLACNQFNFCFQGKKQKIKKLKEKSMKNGTNNSK